MPYQPVPPFTVIDMPLNAAGEGPETDQMEVRRIVYQIWDSNNVAIREYSSPRKADRVCNFLNKEAKQNGKA